MNATPLVIAALTTAAGAPTSDDALCQAARAGAAQWAASNGWQADVRCRGAGSRVLAAGTSLQAVGLAAGTPVRSGPTNWPVRVQAPHAPAYVQQVPLTISWSAPAWVSRRDLSPGTPLQADDLDLQLQRWPDGMAVTPARGDTPPSGRVRQAIRAGDLVAATQLLPPGTLLRGDRVAAVLADGAMEIRMPAQLLAPARVGDRARAQVQGRTSALEGRLIDAQTLKVDSE